MAKFAKGDAVAWHSTIAAQHAVGSILRTDALPPKTPVGTVKEIANDAGTTYVVEFPDEHLAHEAVVEASGTHPEPNCLTLTQDELVRVSDENARMKGGTE